MTMQNSEDFLKELEADVMARTLWGEARGEGVDGMQAVANVILNRVKIAQEKGGYWWGDDVISICQKPFQFSCWNKSDVNFIRLQKVDQKDIHFTTALRISRRALHCGIIDNTHGATHYHSRFIDAPHWTKDVPPRAKIKNHIFYQLVKLEDNA